MGVKPRRTATKPRKPPRKREESSLLANILLAIGSRPDILAVRINTGLYKAPHGERRIRSAPTGFADIVVTQMRMVMEARRIETDFSLREWTEPFYYGQSIYIETKRPSGGTLSKEQIDFGNAALAVCGVYLVPRSVQDVLDALGPVPEWAYNVGRT